MHSMRMLRMLYCFHQRDLIVMSHGFIKRSARVPLFEIKLARLRRQAFERDPARHVFEPGS